MAGPDRSWLGVKSDRVYLAAASLLNGNLSAAAGTAADFIGLRARYVEEVSGEQHLAASCAGCGWCRG